MKVLLSCGFLSVSRVKSYAFLFDVFAFLNTKMLDYITGLYKLESIAANDISSA